MLFVYLLCFVLQRSKSEIHNSAVQMQSKEAAEKSNPSL